MKYSGVERFRDLNLATTYRNGSDDIASAFYVPALSTAIRYDRAVGFFSSSIYAVAWPGLRQFLDSEGHIRIVCSPQLSATDVDAISRGYDARTDSILTRALLSELQSMLESSEMRRSTELLASLVAIGTIDVKVAIFAPDCDASARRMFHDKLGLLTDRYEDTVLFKGSMNETWAGLSPDGNLESVDVFISWGDPREARRVAEHRAFFDALWGGHWPRMRVLPLPDAFRQEIIRIARPHDVASTLGEISKECSKRAGLPPRTSPGRVPQPYQMEALKDWENKGHRGILQHATGSGKTFTALLAIREALLHHQAVIVLVPTTVLLRQWEREIAITLEDLAPDLLTCGAGGASWREPGVLAEWTRSGLRRRIVLSTLATASQEHFLARVRGGKHLFVVADEVHRMGSPEHRKIFALDAGWRLGLSATPQRAGDVTGTESIERWFGPVLVPVYSIADAIQDGRLCRYFYHAKTVALTADEQSEWTGLTHRIQMVLHGRQLQECRDDAGVKRLLIQRARILKQASSKPAAARAIIREAFEEGQRWLVYCDSIDQLQAVVAMLREDGRYRVLTYFSTMQGDPEATLRYFSETGGVLVAIRCLDEGVDIPAADNALILASSRNPREFVQRRGRVLRIAPGKLFAHIYDVLVMPNQDANDIHFGGFVIGEIARAIDFGACAENKSALGLLKVRLAELGVDHTVVSGLGVEDDDEQD